MRGLEKKSHGKGTNIYTTDIATLWSNRPSGPIRWKGHDDGKVVSDLFSDEGHDDGKVVSDLVSDEGHDDGEVGDHPEADDEAVEGDDGVLGARSQPESKGGV